MSQKLPRIEIILFKKTELKPNLEQNQFDEKLKIWLKQFHDKPQ